jgi:hypothetical protein
VLQPLVVGCESVTICYRGAEESWTSCVVKTRKTRVKYSHLSVYCLRSPEVGFHKSKRLMTERTRQILYALRRYPLLPLSEEGRRPSLRFVVPLEWCVLISQWTVPVEINGVTRRRCLYDGKKKLLFTGQGDGNRMARNATHWRRMGVLEMFFHVLLDGGEWSSSLTGLVSTSDIIVQIRSWVDHTGGVAHSGKRSNYSAVVQTVYWSLYWTKCIGTAVRMRVMYERRVLIVTRLILRCVATGASATAER